VESFHSRFPDECLNREQLWTLTEARVVIEDYREKYNRVRPHSKLGYQSPARYAASLHPSLAPVRPAEPAFPPPGMDNQRHLYQHQPIQTDSKGDSKRWSRSGSHDELSRRTVG
jgi:Integrase core domain